ncbi:MULTISPECIES: NADP-dependent oxidoreductase [unclassified Agrococcus]|uniref:NADP-dependent oxidoreductase n=1 Tax=unclassified Agrococcus TaxID=2615065 RepID=UPI00361B09D1
MRRLMHRTFGGPDVLELVHEPDPELGPGEVRVRVHAAALNPVDWKILAGTAAATSRGLEPPLGVGNDIAGVVDAVGEGVHHLVVGDRVLGSARARAMQDRTVVDPAREALVRIPDGLDDVRASCLVVAGRTAWAGIERLALGAGDVVLVHGAAGGVGVLAVQLARMRGARVIGTASERNHDRLVAYGAEAIAYGDGMLDRLRALGGVDAVFETHGTEGIDAGLALGVPADRMVGIAMKGHAGVEGVPTDLAQTGAGLAELAALAADGSLDVPIQSVVPLERAAEAYGVLMGGHVHGKLVVDLLAE